jgi:hypothetical protein
MPNICNRLYGGSIRDCHCRLAAPPFWLPCPEEARGVLVPKSVADAMVARNAAFRSEVHSLNAGVSVGLPATPNNPPAAPGGKAMGFTGSICGHCGSARMVRNGVCETCLDCFTSGECG